MSPNNISMTFSSLVTDLVRRLSYASHLAGFCSLPDKLYNNMDMQELIWNRLLKEIKLAKRYPGVACFRKRNNFTSLSGGIMGPPDSPYYGGIFSIDIQIPEEYPLHPPIVVFRTPIYHPNIDEDGNISLKLLRMPPSGSWNSSTTIGELLVSIQSLLSTPDLSDPLRPDIVALMQSDRKQLKKNVKEYLAKYTRQLTHGKQVSSSSDDSDD